MTTDVEKKLNLLLERTGLGAELLAEAEQERAATVAGARKRKAASIAVFVKERDRLRPLIAAAERKQRELQKQAEESLQELVRLSEQFSTVHETEYACRRECEAVLRANANPAIASLIATLQAELDRGPQAPELLPDPNGAVVVNGQRFRDNRGAVQQRVRTLMDLIDQAERLKVDADVVDEAAEIARIREAAGV